MKKIKVLSFVMVFATFYACKKAEMIEKEKNSSSTTNQIWKIEQESGNSVTVKWKEFKNDSIKIKIPSTWKIEKAKDIWMFIPYVKDNPKLFFSIQKYNVAEVKLNARSYVIEGFKQVSDKIDTFHYTLKKLSFTNGTDSYILTVFTSEKGRNYITYSLIYQPENIIYDFALKTIDDKRNNEANYRKFLLIVQSFEFNKDRIVDGAKFNIAEEKDINFKDL